ncbi:MAG: SixA phosphatase family protein [Mycobacteriales bacterium]
MQNAPLVIPRQRRPWVQAGTAERGETADTAPVRLLLRHADAGVRAEWVGPEEWRGLSGLGRLQAEELVARLRGLPLVRVLSSPSLRCRQTVVPVARALAVDVEPRRELADDADPVRLIRLLEDPETDGAVLCTHRETLEALFAHLARKDTVIPDSDPPMEKAAAWLLRGVVANGANGANGASVQLRYLPARHSAGQRRRNPPVH